MEYETTAHVMRWAQKEKLFGDLFCLSDNKAYIEYQNAIYVLKRVNTTSWRVIETHQTSKIEFVKSNHLEIDWKFAGLAINPDENISSSMIENRHKEFLNRILLDIFRK